MARQKITPAYLPPDGGPTATLDQAPLREAEIQALIHKHPEILPISQIDSAFTDAVSICREFPVPSGRIDNLLITRSGLPIIAECKLWRNPEARRKVVAQILDYARELSLFNSAGIQAKVKDQVPDLYQHVSRHHPEIDEAEFHDNLSLSLARGRFLLLIVGDGITASVEAIFEQLSRNATLHFSFGMIEMPVFNLPDGGQLAVPRVIAKTASEVRWVVDFAAGLALKEQRGLDDEFEGEGFISDRPASFVAGQNARVQFWTDFLADLKLDDPEQPLPRPSSRGSLSFSLPVPGYNSWLTVWRSPASGEVGVFLSFKAGSIGQRVAQYLVDAYSDQILRDLGGTSSISSKEDTPVFRDRKVFGDLSDPEVAKRARAWLGERVNRFINVLRPAVRSAVVDLQEE